MTGRYGLDKPVAVAKDPGISDVPIEGFRPDLTVAVSAGLSPYRYGIDERIAPTIAGPVGVDDFSTPWQEDTRLIGQAVGKPSQAGKLIADLAARFARTPARYPQLVGLTAVCLQSSGRGDGVYDPEGPQEPCARFLAGLGMRSVPALDRESGQFVPRTTPEQIAGPDRPDVVVFNGLARDPREYARGLLPPGVPAVTLDDDEAARVAFPSVLGLPSALDTVAPRLARAIG